MGYYMRMSKDVVKGMFHSLYEHGYITLEERDLLNGQASNSSILLLSDLPRTREIEVTVESYYAFIVIDYFISFDVSIIVNQYNGYLMYEYEFRCSDSTTFTECTN